MFQLAPGSMTSEVNPYEVSSIATDAVVVDPRLARRQLMPVAISLLVLSILHITGGLFYYVYVFSQWAAPEADPTVTHLHTVSSLYYGVTMLYCLLLITGAFSMMRQGSYMWAMTVCILALVPFFGPCYLLGVPIGIWGIIVLKRPAVRDSFAKM